MCGKKFEEIPTTGRLNRSGLAKTLLLLPADYLNCVAIDVVYLNSVA